MTCDEAEFDLESSPGNGNAGWLRFRIPSDEEFELLFTKFGDQLGNAF